MSNKTISEARFLKALGSFIKNKYNSSLAAAATWGVSASYVNKMRTGDRLPTKAVLSEMGYELVPPTPQPVRYRRK